MPFVEYQPDTVHTRNDNPRCPICSRPARVYQRKQPAQFEGQCESCGDVLIWPEAAELARNRGGAHLLSAWLRRVPPGKLPPTLNMETVEQILKDSPAFTPLDKLDLALQQVAAKTSEPGQRSHFSVENDYPLVYARSPNEAIFYLREQAKLGYLEEDMGIAKVTAKGFERLAQVQHEGRHSEIAFVAMWFDMGTEAIFNDAIKPAIEQAGYRALRIDKTEHVNRIDDEIIAQLRRSRFMVADFTGQRPGVYFEAGFMQGLGRDVIWMCHKSALPTLHFDVRQFNFIDYVNVSEAKERLYNRIVRLQGEGSAPKEHVGSAPLDTVR